MIDALSTETIIEMYNTLGIIEQLYNHKMQDDHADRLKAVIEQAEKEGAA